MLIHLYNRNRIFAVLALLTLLLTAGCLGPRPTVEGYTAQWPQPGSNEPAKIDATIANAGVGDGQIEVTIRLSSKATGETLAQDAVELELQKDERTHVVFELDLPASAAKLRPEDIEVKLDAQYPIQ